MQSHFTVVVVVVARGGSGSAVYFLNCCASYRRGRDSENGLRMYGNGRVRGNGGGGESEGEEEMSRSFELSPWIIARASELAVHESRDDSGGITRRLPQVR